MFGRKDNDTYLISYNGDEARVSLDAWSIFISLKEELRDVKREKENLENELKCLRPIIESPGYTAPKSKECDDCKFVVKNRCNGQVVGCRREALCDDFVPAAVKEE